MKQELVTQKLQAFIMQQIDSMSQHNPLIAFIRPVVSRVIEKKLPEINGVLGLLSDKEGNIDAIGILNEMLASLMSTDKFTISLPVLGDATIGNGLIRIGIPFTDKNIVLGESDFIELRNLLTE